MLLIPRGILQDYVDDDLVLVYPFDEERVRYVIDADGVAADERLLRRCFPELEWAGITKLTVQLVRSRPFASTVSLA
jgi:hypothetical protein